MELLAALAALVALALLARLLWHAWHLARLRRWLADPVPGKVPEGSGAWDDALAALYRLERDSAKREQSLAEALAHMRRAVQALPDGMVLLDGANRIEWCNRTAEAQLKLDGKADLGQHIGNLVREPDFVDYLQSPGADAVRISRDGTVLSLQLIAFGQAQKLLLVRDVTQAERVETMRRDFVANVSHELRTPLTVLVGFLETLQNLRLDAQRQRDYLGMMQEQARNMQRLVADLLTLSALETDQGTTDDERFAVAPLLLALASDARALSKGQHAIELDLGIGASVLGSRDELASAFGNLVSNAIRYTPEGGRIALAWLVEPGGSATFSVTDSGIGIAAEHVPRLTERFYRVDRSRSRATGGTGLGLAIVKHVLLRHQAQLEITSEPGRGSRFAVRLPARRITVAPAPPVEPAGAGADRSEAQRPFESG
jgi:two-component system phosphate regulon sensor histidine kinase PhoR